MQPGTKFFVGVVSACLFTIGALVITVVAITRQSSWQQVISPSSSSANAKPDLVVGAQSLFESYMTNPAVADQVYNSKLLEVSGTVASVGSDKKGSYMIFAVVRPHPPGPVSLNQMYNRIAAASASGVQGVRCYFSSNKPPKLETGQEITIRGKCAGKPLDVEIRECRLQSP